MECVLLPLADVINELMGQAVGVLVEQTILTGCSMRQALLIVDRHPRRSRLAINMCFQLCDAVASPDHALVIVARASCNLVSAHQT